MTTLKLALDAGQIDWCSRYGRAYQNLTGCPLVLPPSMYDSLEAAGVDMEGYVPAPRIPTWLAA